MNRIGYAVSSVFLLAGCNCGDDLGLTDAGADAGRVISQADSGSVAPQADAGASDAGEFGTVDSGSGSFDAGLDGGARAFCSFGTAQSSATAGNLNLFGVISYFADGQALPKGRYRIQYIDGCMKYASDQDWTIHAYAYPGLGWYLVGGSSNTRYGQAPGTVGYSAATGAFAAFDDCVAANRRLAPVDFDFDGGVLGLWLLDNPYDDNLAGIDGRNPSYTLTGRGVCDAGM